MSKFINKSINSLILSFDGQLDSLTNDESTVQYISSLLSDLEISKDEKQETIQGILELHLDSSNQLLTSPSNGIGCSKNCSSSIVESDSTPNPPKNLEESVKELIDRVDLYHSNQSDNYEEFDSDSTSSSRRSTGTSSTSSSVSPEKLRKLDEEEKLKEIERKKAIVDNYGKIEVDQSSISKIDRHPSSSVAITQSVDQEAEEVPKDLLDQELKLLDMKKRQRKKIESKKYTNPDDLLLRPNLNSKLIEHENKLKKIELSLKNRAKIEKDKADLIKQKESQLKKKLEARSKAKKLERRA